MSLGWGIIGTGAHAERAMGPALSRAANTKLAAVCDCSLERARTFAVKYRVERCYASLEKMLDDPVSGNYLCVVEAFNRCIEEDEAKIGDKVVVIGGGNAALDSARSALRLGASEVAIACLEPADGMLASPEEIDWAKEEGVTIHNSQTFTRIVGDNGYVSGVDCLDVKSFNFDDAGKLSVESISGSEHILPADTVIIAIGQLPELGLVEGVSGIKTTKRHTLEVDPETFETNREGVFAGGDVVSGPATVIEAMATGKEVAKAIDCYLHGEKYKKGDKTFTPATHVERVPISTEERGRLWPEIQLLPVAARTGNFNEVELGFTPKMATLEAMRCLRCDLQVSRHEELRLSGQMGDTTGHPSEQDLAELENKAANLAKWLLREAHHAPNSH